ncbi:MAG: hypothetical protein QNI91_00105 [Arenicellales bacterium]|nr:hypothetical protein [Arenicellales bacterium]
MSDRKLPTTSSRKQIDRFLQQAAKTPVLKAADERGRLIFAMDATASRQPTWDRACKIQGDMFLETESLGGLEVQLCFYRGHGEFNSSSWFTSTHDLLKRMTGVFCLGGLTQIFKVLKHTIKETKKKKVHALVFVGDCMEENVDALCHLAGQLGVLNVPVFIFHEGNDPAASTAFTQIARLSGGACCPFDANSASQLKELLSAVAVYAAGGRRALEDYSKGKKGPLALLTQQLHKG